MSINRTTLNWLDPHGGTQIGYRPEIDGLRAVAIISVVGFHVGLPGFAGGFVGVDVFFVISGFLITSLLLTELRQRGSIDLLAFFARRVRRLLPAFFLVAAITLILGVFFLVPVDEEQQRLADSAKAAALYISNFHFGWFGDDYFDPDSSLFPLLHTWSLAVEEQFYLLWPLMLLGAVWAASRAKLELRWVIGGVLAVVLVASLHYSWEAAESDDSTARFAFFALGARAWELAIGAALALMLPTSQRLGRSSGTLLAAAGVTAIGTAVVLFHKGIPFPGIAALVPTLGAAAIITGICLAPGTTIARGLASRPMVVIGLLSYSWYLWHWPLLAIARAHALGVQDLWRDLSLAVLALGLAGLTFILVENPVRRRKVAINWSNSRVLGAAAAASLTIIVAAQGLKLHANALEMSRFQQLVDARAQLEKSWARVFCEHRKNFRQLIPISKCMPHIHVDQELLVVWGDSHAAQWVDALETAIDDGRLSSLPRWMGGCPPLLDVIPVKAGRPEDHCVRFNRSVLTEIKALHRSGRLTGVVLAARWSAYLDEHTLSGEQGRTLWREGRLGQGTLPMDVLAHGLRSTLAELSELGIKILVIAPSPEQRFEVPLCLARRSVEFCSGSRRTAEDYRARALRAIQTAMMGSTNGYLWDPLPALCDASRCAVERDGIIIYSDEHHLNPAHDNSRRLAHEISNSAGWQAVVQKLKPAENGP